MSIIFKSNLNQLRELMAYVVNNSLADVSDYDEFDSAMVFTPDDMTFSIQVDENQTNFVDIKSFFGRKIGLFIYEYDNSKDLWIIYNDRFDPYLTSISSGYTPLSLAQMIDDNAYVITLEKLPDYYKNIPYLLLENTETKTGKLYRFDNLYNSMQAINILRSRLEFSNHTITSDSRTIIFDEFRLTVHLGSELEKIINAQDIVNTFYYKEIENIRTEDLYVRINS